MKSPEHVNKLFHDICDLYFKYFSITAMRIYNLLLEMFINAINNISDRSYRAENQSEWAIIIAVVALVFSVLAFYNSL